MPPVVPSRLSHQVLAWSSFLSLVPLCSCYFLPLSALHLSWWRSLLLPFVHTCWHLTTRRSFTLVLWSLPFQIYLLSESLFANLVIISWRQERKVYVISSAGEEGYSCLGVAALDRSPRIAWGLHTLEMPVSLCYQGTQRVLPSPLHPSCDLEKFPDFLKHSSLMITTYIFPYRMTTFSKTCTPWGLLIHPFRNLVG